MPSLCGCTIAGCEKDARWQIGFRIWPTGAKLQPNVRPVEGLCGVLVCDEHTIRDPSQFFTARGKEAIAMGFMKAGRGLPDFTTAEIIHSSIVDDDPLTADEAQRLGGVLDEIGA